MIRDPAQDACAAHLILKSPIFRAIIQIAICATPGVNMFGCAAASGLLTLASGGSVLDAVKAFAFSFAQMGAFTEVSSTLNGLQAGNMVLGTLVKAGVHGIIGGAISLAQGGSFLQGFAGSAVGAIGGAIAGQSGLVGQYGDGNSANMLARALISGAAGCAGAIVTGGKCAQAAVTAAFASLYNGDGPAGIGDNSKKFPEIGGLEEPENMKPGPGLMLRAFGPLGWFVFGLTAGSDPLNVDGGLLPKFTGSVPTRCRPTLRW